jgi:hypothetical protein
MPIVVTPPSNPYINVFTEAVSNTFVQQVTIALAAVGAACIAGGGDKASCNLYCFGGDPTCPQRVAYRVVVTPGLPLAPTDAQVQAVVTPLIPASGPFTL